MKYQDLQWAHQPLPAIGQQFQLHFYVSTFGLTKTLHEIYGNGIIMSSYILINKTFVVYQQAHLFPGHTLLPFLFHLERGSVSSFSLGIKFAHTDQKADIKTMQFACSFDEKRS